MSIADRTGSLPSTSLVWLTVHLSVLSWSYDKAQIIEYGYGIHGGFDAVKSTQFSPLKVLLLMLKIGGRKSDMF